MITWESYFVLLQSTLKHMQLLSQLLPCMEVINVYQVQLMTVPKHQSVITLINILFTTMATFRKIVKIYISLIHVRETTRKHRIKRDQTLYRDSYILPCL